MTAVPDIVEFLVQCPPFDAFGPGAVERLAGAVEVEFHPAGATIFAQGAEAVEFLRVIRAGAVEVLDDGRVLDLMGPGEMFGYASLLSGLPTDFGTRAHEDTLSWGYGSELAARMADELFFHLDAPVRRVAAKDTWVAYYPALEDEILPQPKDFLEAYRKLAAI